MKSIGAFCVITSVIILAAVTGGIEHLSATPRFIDLIILGLATILALCLALLGVNLIEDK